MWFRARLKAVTAKRAKTVIDHILKHGHITTEQLKTLYGYLDRGRNSRVRSIGQISEEGRACAA
jgi:hypothetical protein